MSERWWVVVGRWADVEGAPIMTDVEALAKMGAERVWWCEYPEFNDPDCMTGMGVPPRPGLAALPHKHTRCGWVWIVKEGG